MSGKTVKESLKVLVGFSPLAFTYNITVPTDLAHETAKYFSKGERILCESLLRF